MSGSTPDPRLKQQAETSLSRLEQTWATLSRLLSASASDPTTYIHAHEDIEARKREMDQELRRLGELCFAWVEQGGCLSFESMSLQGRGVDADAQVAPHGAAPPEGSADPGLKRAGYRAAAGAPRSTNDAHAAAMVQEIVEELGSVPALHGPDTVDEEFARVRELMTTEHLETWEELPAEVRVTLMEHLAARTRAIQELPKAERPTVEQPELTELFSAMANHLKISYPGKAHGLARRHTPRSGTWRQDAQDKLKRLVELQQIYARKAQGLDPMHLWAGSEQVEGAE
ncbi:MAG: hypothetical protein AAGI01_07910 [Myxococcota bacterium]